MAQAYSREDQRMILIATSVACMVTPLMSTMMNLSLVGIGNDFGVGSHNLAYVNTMFLLGSVVCMVPAAKFASIHGMKKVFIGGLVMMVACTAAAFFSPSFNFLILMRFLIGFAASMMTVTGMALLTFVFPANKRGKVIGLNATFVYIGLSLGPTIGGVITDTLGWRYVFAFIFILSVIALGTVLMFRNEAVPTPEDRMDWGGSILWGFMIITLMSGLINITTPWGPAAAVIGGVLLIITWWYLRNRESPVLETKMFRNKAFTKACIAAFMNYGASYSITFFLALYLQHIGEISATEAGTLMLVQPLMQVLLTARMGALSDRLTDKRILPTLGMAITGVGVSMYLFLDTNYSLPYVVAIMVVTGIGLGIFSAPNNSIIMSTVPPHLKGEASGMVAVVRQTGMMVSMSISMSAIAIIMGSADNLNPSTYGAFIDVIHTTFAICLGMCIVGIICSLVKIKVVQE
ncbi:MAG: MFS transporter [archaeon]|nr:MFS transporter [archaeon]